MCRIHKQRVGYICPLTYRHTDILQHDLLAEYTNHKKETHTIVSETMYIKLCYELIIITYSAICLGREETRVKCASFFRLCHCLTTVVYLAVSLHHFDTIVKNDMSWESPTIKTVPFRWHIVETKMEPFNNSFLGVLKKTALNSHKYVVVATVRKDILGSGLLM